MHNVIPKQPLKLYIKRFTQINQIGIIKNVQENNSPKCYVSNKTSNYIKQKFSALKGEMGKKSIIILGDFNIPFSTTKRETRQKSEIIKRLEEHHEPKGSN